MKSKQLFLDSQKPGGHSWQTTVPKIEEIGQYQQLRLTGADSGAETARVASTRVGKPNYN